MTLTNEQIKQKKQRLKQLAAEAQQLTNELIEVGAWPLSDDDLDEATGGKKVQPGTTLPEQSHPLAEPDRDLLTYAINRLLGGHK